MRRALVFGCLFGLACGQMPVVEDAGFAVLDAGVSMDAGSVIDAGSTIDGGMTMDAGSVIDAGVMMDAGSVVDAGVMMDAGSVVDAGVTMDAGSTIDAGVTMDAGFVIDAGVTMDAGVVIDAGVTMDAGSTIDAGVPMDAGFTLPDGGSICGRCSSYGSVQNMGMISLNEISGLAASRQNPGVLYGHNDSGGAAALTVMRTNGATIGTINLMGATNLDWEDLAIGPCPTGTCLYVGEIGDNASSNLTYAVYRVTEPVIPAGMSLGTVTLPSERFELAYPNNLKTDAETLLIHPVSGDLYIVSKQQFGTKSTAYKATAPLMPVSPNVMTRISMMAVPDGLDLPITGGDIDPCGTTLLLRSYSVLYQFVLPAAATSFDAIFTAPFTRVPVSPFPAGEAQGESVCWNPGGGYFTASEGASQQLHFVACQ